MTQCAVCRGLEDVGEKTIELKRRRTMPMTGPDSRRDRCRRATEDLVSAEEELNDSLGRLGQLVTDTAGASHALSCGVPDRGSNEAKYLQEARDIIDDSQRRNSRR